MGALGAARAQAGYESDYIHDGHWNPNSHVWMISDEKRGNRRNWCCFQNHHYVNGASGVKYGNANIIADDKQEVDGTAQTFDNSGYPRASKEKYSREVKKMSEVTHTMKEAHNMNLKSTTTIKGTYSGVSFEQKLEAAYGFMIDKFDTEKESTTETESLTDDFTVEAGEIVVCSAEKERLIVETPYSIDTVFDCKVIIDLEDWAGIGLYLWGRGKKKRRSHSNHFEFNSLIDFERFLKGYHVEYAKMKDFPYEHGYQAEKCMNWLFNPNHRLIQSTGVKRRVYDNAIRIRKVSNKRGEIKGA